MCHWNIAAAQVDSRAGELNRNIERHLAFIRQACALGVELIIFPEYSLCGLPSRDYHPPAISDAELAPLQHAARRGRITVVAGLPLPQRQRLVSGAVSFMPDGGKITCASICHPASLLQRGLPIVGRRGRRFSLGLNGSCDEEALARDAALHGANLYTTGRFACERSWPAASSHLQQWAHKYQMAVLMANHTGPGAGIRCGGHSACWDERGQLVVRADEGELLVIGRRGPGGWQGEVVPLR